MLIVSLYFSQEKARKHMVKVFELLSISMESVKLINSSLEVWQF